MEASPYDKQYWERYQSYKLTDIGLKLNQARLDLVTKYQPDFLVDIGIGNGAFVEALDNAYGADINPEAIDWLKSVNRLWDNQEIDCMTFWDSIEHIHNPTELLNLAKRYVFISTPIYKDKDHVLQSKHFRPDEHCWYFTKQGLVDFISNFGFKLVEYSDIETELGREDIGSFVFERLWKLEN